MTKIGTLINSHRALTFGCVVIGGLLAASIIGPLAWPDSPNQANVAAVLQPPSLSHPFGTDEYGYDILSRVMYAPRVDLLIAFVATVAAVMVGVSLGLFAGFFAAWRGLLGLSSELVMRLMDVFQAFPVFILALAFVAGSGRSMTNVILAIIFVNVPVFVRLLRSEVLRIRERSHVDAAFLVGNPRWRIAARHILPLGLSPVVVQCSVTAGFAILLTAGLSFVGAGVRPPTPEWGLMIATGAPDIITGVWWAALFPGLFLGLAVFSLALIGNELGSLLKRGE